MPNRSVKRRGLWKRQRSLLAICLGGVLSLSACVKSADATSADLRNLQFSAIAGSELALDLYRPSTAVPAKGVIVWVHGGAWRSGTRASVGLLEMVNQGWVVASVDYRLSPEARFPAQIHDIKAAIRFLRAEAKRLKIPASPIVIAGSSAGGHLAALVGVSNGHKQLEGSRGTPKTSSDVQGIIDLFGASNFMSILRQSTPHGLAVRKPALELLLGEDPEKIPDLARLASPVFHVDKSDPPLLLLHGDQDIQMPINQAHELQAVYSEKGLVVQFDVLHGAGHGGPQFSSAAQIAAIADFLEKHVVSQSAASKI